MRPQGHACPHGKPGTAPLLPSTIRETFAVRGGRGRSCNSSRRRSRSIRRKGWAEAEGIPDTEAITVTAAAAKTNPGAETTDGEEAHRRHRSTLDPVSSWKAVSFPIGSSVPLQLLPEVPSLFCSTFVRLEDINPAFKWLLVVLELDSSFINMSMHSVGKSWPDSWISGKCYYLEAVREDKK